MPISTAMMPMTTSSSTRVNPVRARDFKRILPLRELNTLESQAPLRGDALPRAESVYRTFVLQHNEIICNEGRPADRRIRIRGHDLEFVLAWSSCIACDEGSKQAVRSDS